MPYPGLTRRTLFVTASLGTVATRATRAQSRSVRLVVPYPPGGPGDVIGRLLAPSFAAETGETLVVDNRPGGNATIGTLAVAGAAPDGSVIGLGSSQTHAINATMMEVLPYRPVEDFTPICGLVALPHVLVVPTTSPHRDFRGLLAALRAEPGRYNHGSTGNGSGGHLGGAMLMRSAGVSSTHVPFRGSAPLTTELLAGRVDYAIVTLASVLGQLRSGAFRVLGAASPRRLPQLPEIPTLAELGTPGVELDAWFALFGPAGLPPAYVGAVERAARRAVADPVAVERLESAGFVTWWQPADALRALLPGEIARWRAVVRDAGARVE